MCARACQSLSSRRRAEDITFCPNGVFEPRSSGELAQYAYNELANLHQAKVCHMTYIDGVWDLTDFNVQSNRALEIEPISAMDPYLACEQSLKVVAWDASTSEFKADYPEIIECRSDRVCACAPRYGLYGDVVSRAVDREKLASWGSPKPAFGYEWIETGGTWRASRQLATTERVTCVRVAL